MRRITPWLPRYEIACRLTRRRNEIHYKRRLSNYFPIKEENLKKKKKKNEIEKFHTTIERTIRRVKQ